MNNFINVLKIQYGTVIPDDGSELGSFESPSLQANAIVSIIQLVLFITGIVLIVRAIYRFVKCSQKKKLLKKKQEENLASPAEIEQEKLKLDDEKGEGIVWIVLGFISWFLSSALSMIKTFKPIIYIYPEEDNTDVSVTLSKPNQITCSYPKYNNGWNVIVDKDGTIRNQDREYYSLYWEGMIHPKEMKDGFVVSGEDTAKFFEEKLALLGLTDKEAEEFIIYWLPKMENNKYNLIRFLTAEELNEEMALEVKPKPDTLIRISMQYKPLLFKQDIPEQKLERVERKGFTVVEWGGGEI